jgi:hypothetical protein
MTVDLRIEILVFAFEAPAARLEGELIGALERAEAGGALRILEIFAVGREDVSGEPWAVHATGDRGGMFGVLVDARLDAGQRRRSTAAVLEGGGNEQDAVHELLGILPAGASVVATTVEHVWHSALTTAVRRGGGWLVADDVCGDLPDTLAAEVLSVLRRAEAGHGW